MKELSTRLKSTEVKIDDRIFKVRELTGKQRETYMDMVGKKLKYDGNGKAIGLASYEGSMTFLVQMSLVDEDGRNVPIDAINQWPQSIIESLYEEAQALSGLGKKAEEEIKNASEGNA